MLAEPNCRKRRCKHFLGVKSDSDGDEMTERVVCRAFPNRIPFIIAYGSDKHLKPFRGDNGIQFEKGPTEFDKRLTELKKDELSSSK